MYMNRLRIYRVLIFVLTLITVSSVQAQTMQGELEITFEGWSETWRGRNLNNNFIIPTPFLYINGVKVIFPEAIQTPGHLNTVRTSTFFCADENDILTGGVLFGAADAGLNGSPYLVNGTLSINNRILREGDVISHSISFEHDKERLYMNMYIRYKKKECLYIDIEDEHVICNIGSLTLRELVIRNGDRFRQSLSSPVRWSYRPAGSNGAWVSLTEYPPAQRDARLSFDMVNPLLHPAAGEYEFRIQAYSAEARCPVERIVNVTIVDNPPVAGALAPMPRTMCEGEPVLLTGPVDMERYEWFRGGELLSCRPQYTFSAAGDYSLTVLSEEGCKVNYPFQLLRNEHDPVTLTEPDEGFFLCDELELVIPNAASFEELIVTPGVLSGSLVQVSEVGRYILTGKDINGCVSAYEWDVQACNAVSWDGSGGRTISSGIVSKDQLLDPNTNAGLIVGDIGTYPLEEEPFYVAFPVLRYDGTDEVGSTADWELQVTYDLYEDGMLSPFITDQKLSIRHQPGNKIYEASNRHHLSSGSGKVLELVVTDITFTGTLPDNLYLEQELRVLYRPELSLTGQVDLLTHQLDDINHKARLQWDDFHGAYEYEVELAWLDKYAQDFSAPEMDRVFGEFGWSFTLSQSWTDIDLIYPEGKLFYRVRPVGRHAIEQIGGVKSIKTGLWSEIGSILIEGGSISAFEPDRIWQRNVTYAEEGKKKEVVSYMDALLRGKQVQTNLNTDQTTLVAETYYDSESRPVLNILPVPLRKNHLKYEPDLAVVNTSSGIRPLLKTDFEQREQPGLSTHAGAAKYYSSANPFKGLDTYTNIDLLPSAEKEGDPSEAYVAALIQYKRDNTGRVSISGGIGEAFRVGSTATAGIHPTRYIYGDADKTELRRLFGASVWDARQYTKELIIDPNGQLSYSYKDIAGRIVATSLAGNAPVNLLPLSSVQQNPLYRSLDNEINAVPKIRTSQFSKTIINDAVNKSYEFEYSLEGVVNTLGPFAEGNVTIAEHCKTCVYKVEIFVLDPNGETVKGANISAFTYDLPGYSQDQLLSSQSSPPSFTPLSVNAEGKILYTFDNDDEQDPELPDYSCPRSEQEYHRGIRFLVTMPDIGAYTVIRKLSVDPGDLSVYGQSLKPGSPGSPATILPGPDRSCYIDIECSCNQCMSECYDWLQQEFPGIDVCAEQNTWPTGAADFFENCNQQYCTAEGILDNDGEEILQEECNIAFLNMQNQVSPGGYWFEMENDVNTQQSGFDVLIDNLPAAAKDGLAYYFQSVDEAFSWESAQHNNKDWFAAHWSDQVVSFLVEGHPEYCHSAMCENEHYLAGKLYDLRLEIMDVLTSGHEDIVLEDPILDMFDSEYREEFIRIINSNFPLRGDKGELIANGCGLFSLLDYNNTGNCGNTDGSVSTFRDYLYNGLTETADKNKRRWDAFVGMYRFAKRELIDRWIEDHMGCPFYSKSTTATLYSESPVYPRAADAMFPTGNDDMTGAQDDLFDVLKESCDQVARSYLGRLLDMCNIDLRNYLPNPPQHVMTGEYQDAYLALFQHTHDKLADFCRLAVDVNNPFGWITPSVMQDYNNNALDPAKRDAIEAVLEAIDDDIDNIMDNLETYQLQENITLDIPLIDNQCIKNKLSSGTDIGADCEPNIQLLPDLSCTPDSEEPVVQWPEWVEDGYTFTVCNVACIEEAVNFTGKKENKVRVDPYDISLPEPCSSYNKITIRGDASPGLFWESYPSLPFYRVLLDGFTLNMGGDLLPCPNCNVHFFFVDDQGQRITNIESLASLGYLEEGPVTLPVAPNTMTIVPMFTHLTYNATAFEQGPNGWSRITRQVYLYAMGYNHQGVCGSELLGVCDQLTYDINICYPPVELPEEPDCEDRLALYYEGIDRFVNGRDAEIAVNTTINEHVNNCLSYNEHLRYSTSFNEYHYTLYYYDRAGNLVETVPPSGVYPLSNGDANALAPPDPSHTLQTYYKYNTRGQVTWQKTPDAGESRFWYNDKGLLILSQNARQATQGEFSFTNYDGLGRIVLVGQLNTTGTTLRNTGEPLSETAIAATVQAEDFPFNLGNTAILSELTHTVYDKPVYVAGIVQQHLLNRVSATWYYEDYSALQSKDGRGTIYSYDELGNVKTLLQDLSTTDYAQLAPDRKRVDYEYDLVSGKVNKVKYQAGKADQFTHRYEYDADNRITDVYTTRDGVIEHHDAKYYYYPHGPLARVELGTGKVQGLDYYYTLQGWLKGINNPAEGADADGSAGLFSRVGKDELQLQLGYYEGDYHPVGGIAPPDILAQYQSAYYNAANAEDQAFYDSRGKGLYNGNIALMATGLGAFSDPLFPDGKWKVNEYQYDQLNRIKAMNSVGQYDPTSGTPFASAISSLKTRYSYDGNGNISHLSRTAWKTGEANPVLMDNMTYHYQSGTNKLQYVTDPVDKDAFKEDIDNQQSGNYEYDAIGNLTADEQEGIEEIEWNVYGKIAGIKYSTGRNKDDLAFLYDATGQRVAKIVKKKDTNGEYDPQLYTSTWYIRDAQGNVLYTEVRKPEEEGIRVTDKEYPVYGSSRLGMYREQDTDPGAPASVNDYERRVGSREYELTNHLGNVLATVSDYKVYDQGEDAYYASVLTAQDYYPFGMQIPGRSYRPVSCEEVETEGAGVVQHTEGFEELTTTVTPWTEGIYSGEVINGWDSRLGVYVHLSTMPLGEIVWEEVSGNGKLKYTESQLIDGSYLTVAARTYEVEPSTTYRLSLDVSSTESFQLFMGVVDKELLETYLDIEAIARLASEDATSSGPVELEFTTTTEEEVIFYAVLFRADANDEVWLDNVKLEKVTDDEPPVITVEVNDAFGSGITPWRNTILEDPDRVNIPLGLLSYDDTGERVRVDLVPNNDDMGTPEPEDDDIRMTGVMMRLFTMQPDKRYLFSYDSKDMNNLSPSMRVGLISKATLDRGIFIDLDQVYPVTATADHYEVEIIPASAEMYVVIIQEHEGDNDPYHYYVDNIQLREGWIVNTVCDDPNDPGIAKGRYRYGFNGMEMDSEVSGDGNSYTTEFRQNDPRLGGRWWSRDFIIKPWESPYAGYGNNPVLFVDPSGLDHYESKKAPKDAKEGDTWTKKTRKGEWDYEYRNGEWQGSGGSFETDEIIVIAPERKQGERRSKEQGALWVTDLGREAIFPKGMAPPSGWTYLGTGLYSTAGRSNMIQIMYDYPFTYHLFMPPTALSWQISEEFRKGGSDARMAFEVAMAVPALLEIGWSGFIRFRLLTVAKTPAVQAIEAGAGLIDDAVGMGDNVVYHSVQNGVTRYVGITNNLARRAAQHLATKGINIEPLMQGLSRADARAVEQALIEIHGLGKNGGTLLNKINSIAVSNPSYSAQLQRGYELLSSIGYR